jgi:signal transduction histidine kinase
MELAILYDDNRLVSAGQTSAGQRLRVDEYPAIRQAMAQMTPLILEADEQELVARPQADRDTGKIYRLLGHDQSGPLLIQPLEHISQVIGAVLVCRAHDKTPFTPSEARKSETLAAYLGMAIGNARRYQEIEARLEQLAAELETKETVHTRIRTDLENRLTRSEEQATLYMQRLYEAELGEQQAQEDARQARRKLSVLRQESQTEVTHARDELKHSIQQATRLTQQIANLDAQCLELGNIVQTLEQEKDLLQLRLAVTATEQSDLDTDSAESLSAPPSLLPEPGSKLVSTHSTDGLLTALTLELYAPMASVLEYTELFVNSAAGRLGTQQRELLRRVQANIERMQGMLNNLISLDSMHTDTPVLQLARVDVTKMIEVALARARFRLEEKELKTRLAIGVLPALSVDPSYMQQILDNLMSLACRSSRSETTIGIRAYTEDTDGGTRQLHIVISYTSPEPAYKESGHRMLHPAMSTQSQRTNSAHEPDGQEGNAELEIAGRLVEAHQGRIWQESKPGVGETFHLTIPVESTQPLASRRNGRD